MATIDGRSSPTGSAPAWDEVDRLCIQTVHCLAVDAVEGDGKEPLARVPASNREEARVR